jgi:hypothetical protein
MEVGNIAVILFQHSAIPVQPKLVPVTNHIDGDEIAQVFPGTVIQARNVSLVRVGGCSFL